MEAIVLVEVLSVTAVGSGGIMGERIFGREKLNNKERTATTRAIIPAPVLVRGSQLMGLRWTFKVDTASYIHMNLK